MSSDRIPGIVIRAQAGELFSLCYNDVYYFALKTVKDEDIACDITQETFLEVINTIGNLREPAAFVTWIRRITYHQCTRYFNKKKDVQVEEDEDGNTIFDTLADESEGAIPVEVLEKEEFRQTVHSMIDQLSEEQRSAVLLYYFDEMSVGQIAQVQGVSEGTVKSRLNYARKAIKQSVESYEKKSGIKLHSIAILPLLGLYFTKAFMPAARAAQVQAVVAGAASSAAAVTATGTAVAAGSAAASAGTTTATAAAATTVASTATTTAAATTAAAATGGAIAAKITVGVLAASLVAGGVAVGTGVVPAPWKTEPTQSATEETDETAPPTTVTVPREEADDYKSDLLRLYPKSEAYKDVFGDYPGNRLTYFLNKDGKLVNREDPTVPVTFPVQQEIRSYFTLGEYLGCLDTDGVYHIQAGGNMFALEDMLGVPAFVYYSDSLTVFSLAEGTVYINQYGQTGGYQNKPLQIRDGNTGEALENVTAFTEYMRVDSQNSIWGVRLIADGKVYRMETIGLHHDGAGTYANAINTDIREDMLLTDIHDPVLMCKLPADDRQIYVGGELVPLPEDMTADEITGAVGNGAVAMLTFADDTVYLRKSSAEGFVLSQELTELQQAGAIRRAFAAYTNTKDVALVMDDGRTYILSSK